MKIFNRKVDPKDSSEKHAKARCDPTSLGNILTSTGLVNHQELIEALQYQLDNQDQMLGQILVQLGYLTIDEYETAMMKQQVMRNGFKKKEMNACFDIAKRKTDSVVRAHNDLHKATLHLYNKLKVEGG